MARRCDVRGGRLLWPERSRRQAAHISVAVILCAATAAAQDLEPRAYTAAPTGLSFLVVAGTRSSGGVLVDPSLPVRDVDAVVGSVGVGGGRTFSLFGRTAMLLGVVPIARAKATGSIGEDRRSVVRSGLADPRVKLSVNLLGGRAMSPREFARTARPTIVGVSLTVAPPLGQYDRTKLVNLGANRWSFKPEVGVSHAMQRWTVEGYAGAWLFTANDAFYTGTSVRTQQPIAGLQGHVSYTVRPRLWLAFDGTWYSGGTTRIDGVSRGDLQRNSRLGATVSLPVARQQSIKVSLSGGATTRIGADFTTIGAAWQLSWID